MGPMTGRGAGYCAGYDAPGFANPAFGRGGGGGAYGWGRGWRHQYCATGLPGWMRGGAGWGAVGFAGAYAPATGIAPEDARRLEIHSLRERSEHFRSVVQSMEKRIRELEGEEKEDK